MNKKIGIDARLWNETGVGRYIRNLVSYLQSLDTKNQYVLFVRSEDYEELKKNFGLKANWKIVKADIRWHSFAEQILFPYLLYKEHLDLIHFPYFSFPLLYRKKFVITIHDLILHHFSTGEASTLSPLLYRAKLFAYKFLLSQGAKRAEKIITVSQATKSEIIDHLHVPESKVEVTYEGSSKLKTGTQNSKRELKAQNYFLYVGNVYPHKNVMKLIKAFHVFSLNFQLLTKEKSVDEHSKVKLILVGKKDFFYTKLQEKVEQLQLQNEVLFYHHVSDEELANLYQHALALVMPSCMEGFGLPALEAMANECLVIASKIPSLQEICKNAAIYIDPWNTQDILNTLRDVYLKKNTFTKYKKAGLERVQNFSWEKMARETINIYENSISL